MRDKTQPLEKINGRGSSLKEKRLCRVDTGGKQVLVQIKVAREELRCFIDRSPRRGASQRK